MAPVQDMTLKQATELETLSPKIPSADFGWLYDFERVSAKRTHPNRSSVEEAIGMALQPHLAPKRPIT